MNKTVVILLSIIILLSGCQKELPSFSVYENEYALLNEQVDWSNEPIVHFIVDFIIDVSSPQVLFDESSNVVEGIFLGITDTIVVDEMFYLITIYDFQITKSYKGIYERGDIIQVALWGGVLTYDQYEKKIDESGYTRRKEKTPSDEVLLEKYSEEEIKTIQEEMNKKPDPSDLRIENRGCNPGSSKTNSYLLYLSPSDGSAPLLYYTVGLTNGYKPIINGIVHSVGPEDEKAPLFPITDLDKQSLNN